VEKKGRKRSRNEKIVKRIFAICFDTCLARLSKSREVRKREVRKREEKNSCGRMHEEKGVLEQEFIIFQTRYGRI